MKVLLLFLVPLLPYLGNSLECWSCQQGYHSQTDCAVRLPAGMSEVCDGADPECATVIEWFQNGVIQYVRRLCWAPTNTSNPGGFCANYDKNATGQVKSCKSCKNKDLCNGDVVYEPENNRCTSFY